MRHAINLPAIGDLADTTGLSEIAIAADENGWDGLFLWDHVMFHDADAPDHGLPTLDPWLILSSMALPTRHLRLGTLVTPLPSRRVAQVARAGVTLDALSGGRAIAGFGLGGDKRNELTAFGEVRDPRERARIFDTSLDALSALWEDDAPLTRSGSAVQLERAQVLPRPVQKPRIPIWLGAVGWNERPVARAARFDGLAPTEVSPDDLARMVEKVAEIRGDVDGFDFAIPVTPRLPLPKYEQRGATWALHSFWYTHSIEQVLRVVSRRPGERS